MGIQRGSAPEWRKSSHSSANSACVEVASPSLTAIDVRDSKNPRGPWLSFSPEAWTAFVAGVDGGALAD